MRIKIIEQTNASRPVYIERVFQKRVIQKLIWLILLYHSVLSKFVSLQELYSEKQNFNTFWAL